VDPEAVVKPEASIAVIMLASIGGLMMFFGLFFGLIGAIAEPGFLYAAIIICSVAAIMILLAYVGRRSQLKEWRAKEASSALFSRCTYCGFQNDKGTKRCSSCGAPLGSSR
jgi:hypothetical protein